MIYYLSVVFVVAQFGIAMSVKKWAYTVGGKYRAEGALTIFTL